MPSLLPSALAMEDNSPVHSSGDKQVWDRKANQVELFGHAAVTQPGETLTADYIHLDLTTRTLDATGNCVYVASDTFIWGEEMHFNLNTHSGYIVNGRVSSDAFTLRGKMIQKLSNQRFKTHWGEYTTCNDCAASWTLQAEDVDMQMESYGYFSNVTTRIKGAPAFWMPYMIIPLKSQRQTGLLFPMTGFSGDNGFKFVLPFFWATSRSTDMTLWLGTYAARGLRAGLEGRYVLTPRSSGTAVFYYQGDRSFAERPHRWSLDIAQKQELPFGIEQKLKLSEASDNLYPFIFPGDISGVGGEAFMPSSFILSRNSPNVSAYVAFQRYRNLLNATPNNAVAQTTGFDSKTVQVFPNAIVTTNDKSFWNTPFTGGVSFGFSNFSRTSDSFDYDDSSVRFGTQVPNIPPPFRPGIDPIRKATRFSVVPSLYATARLFDMISVVPSVQYRGYFYDFGGLVPPLARGYLHFKTDLTAQLERIYEFPDDPKVPRVKHLIRPLLNYSLIPLKTQDDGHPFVQQINGAMARGIPGYNFDNNDIIPYGYTASSANYFLPQGHSLAYGLTTQWIRRKGAITDASASYQNIIEMSAGQSINFLELTNPTDPGSPHVLTRFFSNLGLNFDKFTAGIGYTYYPEVPVTAATSRHTISANLNVIFERSVHQSVLAFDRSFNIGYSFSRVSSRYSNLTGTAVFSINDYLMPSVTLSYDLENSQLFSANAALKLQSPSRCWSISTGVGYRIETREASFSFDWQVNLSGSGFGTVGDIANSIVNNYN